MSIKNRFVARQVSSQGKCFTSDYRIFYFYTCVGAMKFPFVRNDCLRVSCFYAIIKQYIAIQGSLLHNPSPFHFSSPRGKLKGGARGLRAITEVVPPSGTVRSLHAADIRTAVMRVGSGRRLSLPGRHLGASAERQYDEERGEPPTQVHWLRWPRSGSGHCSAFPTRALSISYLAPGHARGGR